VGGTVSAVATSLAHYLQWGITLAMMLGIIAFIAYGVKNRWGTHWEIHGPLYLTIGASILIMASPSVSCMGDLKWWTGKGVPAWVWIVITVCGFCVLSVATLWNAHICDKIDEMKMKWAELRAPAAEEYDAE